MIDLAATTAAFVKDICTNPDDDAVRLIYADWLEDHGEPERAEFIRVQIELTQPAQRGEAEHCSELLHRERELLTAPHFWGWFDAAVPIASFPGSPAVSINGTACTVGSFDGEAVTRRWTLDVRRGFINAVILPCADFLEHAEALFRAAPLTRVTLSDRAPVKVYRRENDLRYSWWREDFMRGDESTPDPDDLPACLFSLLRSNESLSGYALYFRNREAALAELAAACVRYGRQLAGLPE